MIPCWYPPQCWQNSEHVDGCNPHTPWLYLWLFSLDLLYQDLRLTLARSAGQHGLAWLGIAKGVLHKHNCFLSHSTAAGARLAPAGCCSTCSRHNDIKTNPKTPVVRCMPEPEPTVQLATLAIRVNLTLPLAVLWISSCLAALGSLGLRFRRGRCGSAVPESDIQLNWVVIGIRTWSVCVSTPPMACPDFNQLSKLPVATLCGTHCSIHTNKFGVMRGGKVATTLCLS